jgi:hypothetical protein
LGEKKKVYCYKVRENRDRERLAEYFVLMLGIALREGLSLDFALSIFRSFLTIPKKRLQVFDSKGFSYC